MYAMLSIVAQGVLAACVISCARVDADCKQDDKVTRILMPASQQQAVGTRPFAAAASIFTSAKDKAAHADSAAAADCAEWLPQGWVFLCICGCERGPAGYSYLLMQVSTRTEIAYHHVAHLVDSWPAFAPEPDCVHTTNRQYDPMYPTYAKSAALLDRSLLTGCCRQPVAPSHDHARHTRCCSREWSPQDWALLGLLTVSLALDFAKLTDEWIDKLMDPL